MPSIVVNGVTYTLPPDDYQAQKVPEYNLAIQALASEAGGTNVKKCRAYHNAAQSIANATLIAVTLNSERFDTDTIHDTATNNSRLTCKTAGVYAIFGHVAWANNAVGTIRGLLIKLNGTTFIGAVYAPPITTAAIECYRSVSSLYQLAVNDYVEMFAYQDSGGALNLNSTAALGSEFGMVRVGA